MTVAKPVISDRETELVATIELAAMELMAVAWTKRRVGIAAQIRDLARDAR